MDHVEAEDLVSCWAQVLLADGSVPVPCCCTVYVLTPCNLFLTFSFFLVRAWLCLSNTGPDPIHRPIECEQFLPHEAAQGVKLLSTAMYIPREEYHCYS